MLTKIIITIFIIVSVMFYLRKKNQTSSKSKHTKIAVPSQFKYLTFGFVALSLCLSAAYIFMQWQDDNKVVNVTIISPTSTNAKSYLVRKKDISINEIKTLDGITIRLSNQERIEIADAIN
ncbi:hypothetical protein KO527_07245 [Pseudoalteromonas sp. C2R02]|uniref:hypothetical protein n=1 Tax=Pseudoalteromonas sp. C2R02 TaxID=2841565 RepID=UPI001C08BCA0|nr:hypothetical protein [Pseudoalteromonas sp. C2R02]